MMNDTMNSMELNNTELEQVNGGSLCFGLGIFANKEYCFGEGTTDAVLDYNGAFGIGANYCLFFGAGIGFLM